MKALLACAVAAGATSLAVAKLAGPAPAPEPMVQASTHVAGPRERAARGILWYLSEEARAGRMSTEQAGAAAVGAMRGLGVPDHPAPLPRDLGLTRA